MLSDSNRRECRDTLIHGRGSKCRLHKPSMKINLLDFGRCLGNILVANLQDHCMSDQLGMFDK